MFFAQNMQKKDFQCPFKDAEWNQEETTKENVVD